VADRASELAPARLPVACGAVGDFDAEVVARIDAAIGCELREVHRDGHSVLRLDREPVRWGREPEQGVGWTERTPAAAAAARSWKQAADAGACGIVVCGDRRALHASVSGIAPLYWTGAGGAAYFATAIDPLVGVAGAPEPNWASWAQVLALGYVCGAGTPFAAISRLGPLERLEHEPGGVARADAGHLAWAEVEPREPAGVPERVAAALREEIATFDRQTPVICPLSGGFDSRLLACLLVEAGLDVEAVTVDPDWGHEREQEIAAGVAARLGVSHRLVPPDDRPFADEFADTARTIEHESMLHLALARLRPALPSERRVVVDGLGGDVFLNSRYVTTEVLDAPDSRSQAQALLERFVPPEVGLALFDADAWQALRAVARSSFLDEAERFAGHPASAAFAIYWSRTRRGVSTCPVRLLGTRQPVAMPFLADAVVRSGLLASPRAKAGGDLYRQLFDLVNPAVARLPSIRDAAPRAARSRPRRARSKEARRTYLSLLERSPLRPWFGDKLERAVAERRLGPVLRRSWWLGSRLQTLSALTLWFDRYADSLDPELEPGSAPWAP
jgi:hypothetical protein